MTFINIKLETVKNVEFHEVVSNDILKHEVLDIPIEEPEIESSQTVKENTTSKIQVLSSNSNKRRQNGNMPVVSQLKSVAKKSRLQIK